MKNIQFEGADKPVEVKRCATHLGFLVWLVHNHGWDFTCGTKEMAEGAGLIRTESIRYHLIALEDMGFITVDRRRRPQVIKVNKERYLWMMLPENIRIIEDGLFTIEGPAYSIEELHAITKAEEGKA